MNPSSWFIAILTLFLITSLLYSTLKIRKLKKRYRQKIRELRAHGLNHEELLSEINRLQSLLDLKEEKISFKDQFISSLKDEIQSTNRKADQLEEAMTLKDRQIRDMKTSLKELEDRLGKMRTDFGSKLSSLTSKNTKESVAERDDIISKLQSELSTYDNMILKMNREMIEVQKETKAKENSYKEAVQQVIDSEKKLEETFSQLNEKEEIIEKLQKDMESTRQAAGQFSHEIDQLSSTLENKETEVANIRKGLNSWISKVKELQLELKSKESENIMLLSQLKTKERELEKLRCENRQKETLESSSTKRNPYEILGVSENATFEEVKAAHRKAVKQYNPHIVETLGDDVKELVVETSKEINLAFAWFKKKFNKS